MKLNKHQMNYEELKLWRTMKKELHQHNTHYVRSKFFPHKMNEWQSEHKEIENKYRKEICEMQTKRIDFEKAERLREDEIAAAEALVMMRFVEERKIKYRKQREQRKLQNETSYSGVRRSSRIANKK